MIIDEIRRRRQEAGAEEEGGKTSLNLKQILADPEKADSFRRLLVSEGADGLAERLFEKRLRGIDSNEASADIEELIRFVGKFNKSV